MRMVERKRKKEEEEKLTPVGSTPGTALSMLMPVVVRDGRVVETGEAMIGKELLFGLRD